MGGTEGGGVGLGSANLWAEEVGKLVVTGRRAGDGAVARGVTNVGRVTVARENRIAKHISSCEAFLSCLYFPVLEKPKCQILETRTSDFGQCAISCSLFVKLRTL